MADRLPTLATDLLVDLHEVVVDLAGGGYTRATVAMVRRNLRRCVPSALGATVTLVHDTRVHGGAVEIHLLTHSLAPLEVGSCLRVPLLDDYSTTVARVTFYAAEAGAFDTLLTHLTVDLGVDPCTLEVDLPLPDDRIEPGVTGLIDFTTVNMALGCLLNRGRSLDQARRELTQHATRLHTDIVDAAQTLLDAAQY